MKEETAVVQRINRRLRNADQRERTPRAWFSDLGRYYVLDFKPNRIVEPKDYELLLGSWSYPNT
jgi:hypothetical protein